MQSGGRTMQDAARAQSLRNVLNPGGALQRLADPNTVGQLSVGSGILGANLNN